MKNKCAIILGSDHAGFKAKEYIKKFLLKHGYDTHDTGPYSERRVDYPDFAEKVGVSVAKSKKKKGILVCATGIGVSIAANKIPGVRAALVIDARAARLSREHNDANILALAGRPFNKANARKILKAWLNAEFSGGRHKRRLNKISKIESRYKKNA